MAVTSTLLFDWIATSKDCTSYVSLARAATYFLQRPDSALWTGTDDVKAVALIQATRAVDNYGCIDSDRFRNYFNNQARVFPRNNVLNFSGIVESSGNDSLTDEQLTLDDHEHLEDDAFNFGAVRITKGTGRGQVREVEDFDSATGKITTVEDWTTNPDTTSYYEVIARISDDILQACCEIAYGYVPNSDGIIDQGGDRAELLAQGVTKFKIENHSEEITMIDGYMFPVKAIAILNKYQSFFQ